MIIGLLLLVVFSGAVVLYRTSGIADKQLRSIIALDRKEASAPPQRHKIAMPVESLEREGPGTPSDIVASEATGGVSGSSPGKEADTMRLASSTTTVGRQDELSPQQAGKRPVEEVEKGGPIATREHADPNLQANKKPQPGGTIPTPESSQEIETVSPRAEAGAGKMFFVKVDVGNVRERPSISSGIKFRVRNGCALTVTDRREGWCAVKMDDGRSGWVYHTLLADSLVPGKDDMTLTVRKIEAIRPEAPVDNTAKVVFKLNGPYPPEIMMIEEGRPRVVCDFLDANIASDIDKRIKVGNGIIERIRIGLHKWPQCKARVVLDLVPEQSYELEASFVDEENNYVLLIKSE